MAVSIQAVNMMLMEFHLHRTLWSLLPWCWLTGNHGNNAQLKMVSVMLSLPDEIINNFIMRYTASSPYVGAPKKIGNAIITQCNFHTLLFERTVYRNSGYFSSHFAYNLWQCKKNWGVCHIRLFATCTILSKQRIEQQGHGLEHCKNMSAVLLQQVIPLLVTLPSGWGYLAGGLYVA